MTVTGNPLEDLVEMDLGPAPERVLDILPVEHKNLHSILRCYFCPMTPMEIPV